MSQRPTRHIQSIDGLRALAVAAVLLYHLGLKWIPGGFLGVDLFFVISGYVITRLILDNIETSNGLNLRGFYMARARRLLPGLLFLISCSTVLISIFAPDAIKRFLSDLPYVLTGTNNWRLVAVHQDYFQSSGRPPLLQHTWSLGVESQFYLIWPMILLAIWKYLGKASVARIALIIAAGSGVALFLFSLRMDAQSASSISHVYFGTDTHSIGLFLGSALAVFWIPQNLSARITERAQDVVDGIGIFGLFGLLASFLFISESNSALYKIAFPWSALFGCAAIASSVHPASRFAPIMGQKVLLWIGQRSYGIYLWHWVIFQFTRPSIDLAGEAWALDIFRILLVVALADISLRFVEVPIRTGEVNHWLRGMKYRARSVRKRQRIYLASFLAFLIVTTSTATSVAVYRANHFIKVNRQEMTLIQRPTEKLATGLWVTGDSIILGVKDRLAKKYPIALINARVGRQIDELITVVKQDRLDAKGSPVVIDVGNNNRITESQLIELLDLLKEQPQVILINTSVPRPWKIPNNELVARIAPTYSNVLLVDWATISNNHPEFFAPDGVHLVAQGGDVYTAAIVDALNGILPQ